MFRRLLLLTLLLPAVTVQASDQVTRASDGVTYRGVLQTMVPERVVLERSNGQTVEISTDDIRTIRFNEEPSALQTARSNERSGQYQAALEQLQQIQDSHRGRDRRLNAELQFLTARCQAGLASISAERRQQAVQALKEFCDSHATNFRLPEATLLLAELLAATDQDQAVQLLQQVRRFDVPGFHLQAESVLGQVRLAAGQPEQAAESFEQVVQLATRTDAGAKTVLAARLGLVRCLQAQQQWDQALSALQTLIQDIPEEHVDLLGQAWLLSGDCRQSAGQPKAALLDWLHVDILYSSAQAAHGEALTRLATAWADAGHPERAQDCTHRLQQLTQTKSTP